MLMTYPIGVVVKLPLNGELLSWNGVLLARVPTGT